MTRSRMYDLALAMRAFDLMTLDERREVLRVVAELEYPSADDRFIEAVYRLCNAANPRPSV